MQHSLLSAVLSLSVLLSTLVAAHAASYTFTPLDVPGAIRTEAYGINDDGQIVGNYQDASAVTHGFLYTAGIFTSLDVPGAIVTYAHGINNRGQIVGYYSGSTGDHGFLYDHGVFTFLDVPLPGAVSTVAFDINKRGQIVGSYIDGSGYHGFVYDAGVFTPLDVPDASDRTQALSMNDGGQIVGIYAVSPGGVELHGFFYSDGVFTRLDAPGASQTLAEGINNRGQIVVVNIDPGFLKGFLYANGVYTPLDFPTDTHPLGINDKGQIVGLYGDQYGAHGFVATPTKK